MPHTMPGMKRLSYQHQFECLSEISGHLVTAKKIVKKSKKTKALKELKNASEVLQNRLDWLAVADRHGHDTATAFTEGDGMAGLLASADKRKRLRLAIEATKQGKDGSKPKKPQQQPFRASTPAPAGNWSAAPARPAPAQRLPAEPARPTTRQSTAVCHHCGETGHYVRYCPKLSKS